LPRGRVLEREIDPSISAAYFGAQAALPVDYRNSEFYREMLARLLNLAVPEVLSEVTAFVNANFHTGDNAPQNIGVHIRRSEAPLPLCPYAQPLRYYEAVMNSFPADTRFFISTDSQEAYRWLQARFGSRIFQRPKVHDNRNSVDGVREGLVDMLLLSRCDAIIGTFGSSFSGVAAQASGRPILLLKTVPRIPAGWPYFSAWRWLWAYRHFVVESTLWKRWFIWFLRPQSARVKRIPARCMQLARSWAR
jgi:hypothetical protein